MGTVESWGGFDAASLYDRLEVVGFEAVGRMDCSRHTDCRSIHVSRTVESTYHTPCATHATQ